MARNQQLKRNIARLNRIKDAVKGSLERASSEARTKRGGKHNINVASRLNKAVVANVGEPNSAKGASSKQSVIITQDPGGTHEVAETVEQRS